MDDFHIMRIQEVCIYYPLSKNVSYLQRSFFLTASYDGCVRVHDSAQQPVATISSHSAPVTSACWVSPYVADSLEKDQLVASASFDHMLHLTRLSSFTDPVWATLATLHLHTAPVSSVSASSSGQQLISAGWDGLVGVWTTEVPDQDEVHDVEAVIVRKKRRKVEGSLSNAVKKVRGRHHSLVCLAS
jgi:ribosome biogenesis protein YTM1